MTACVDHGHGKEALRIFEKMQEKGISPDVVSFVCSLKACGSTGSDEKGEEIRTEAERKGLLDTNVHIGSAVVDMYVKFGALSKAQAVFDKLPRRNLVIWNALISGYAEHGLGAQAFEYLKLMQLEGLNPNAITLVCVLKGCMAIAAIDECQVLHAELARKGLVARNAFVGTSLVDMYAKHGWLAKAQEVFDELPARNAVLWTALIAGYTDQACGEEALGCYDEMLSVGISMDSSILTCCLKACGSIGDVEKGKEIHGEIERLGLVGGEISLANALVDMYAKCGFLEQAQEVFDHLCIRNVVSWTSLIAGYVESGFFEEAVEKLKLMEGDGVSPNAVTLLCGLKACGNLGATMEGHEIHEELERKGLETDLVMSNTLVDMYSKCGLVSRARTVLENLKIRDVVSWNVLILGYAEQGQGEEALKCLEEMQAQGVSPDAVTFVGGLKACGGMGAKDKGRELNAELARTGLLEGSIIVQSTLVDMYAKCGLLGLAEQVFDELPVHDVVSWNSLIGGYAQLGETHKVFNGFNKMHGESVNPDLVTFLIVLHSCSGTGFSGESGTYFETMRYQYGVVPTLEHHSCVVDLYSRVGNLGKATAILAEMPFCPNLVVWNTVLSACRNWGNVELGRQAFQNAVRLDKQDGAAYVLMSQTHGGGNL